MAFLARDFPASGDDPVKNFMLEARTLEGAKSSLDKLAHHAVAIELVTLGGVVLVKPLGRSTGQIEGRQPVQSLTILIPKACCTDYNFRWSSAQSSLPHICIACNTQIVFTVQLQVMAEAVTNELSFKYWLDKDIFVEEVSPWLTGNAMDNIVYADALYGLLQETFATETEYIEGALNGLYPRN